uniref:RxLR effector candidate protein n=1 Tax=Hyaloperonospora arabidopsidis (strain Emoy2) TaxID=559515 RepID=M4BN62_HYAAE
MAFMVAGCLLVYFSHRVTTSGWLDAFNGDYAWIGTKSSCSRSTRLCSCSRSCSLGSWPWAGF